MNDLTKPEMKDCIAACWTCRDTCQSTLYNYCLSQGGHHVEQAHVRVMTDCIDICQTAADFMVRSSGLHAAVCAACAEVCDACAGSCDMMDDDAMRTCADTCRACADSCRDMSRLHGDIARTSDPFRPSVRPM